MTKEEMDKVERFEVGQPVIVLKEVPCPFCPGEGFSFVCPVCHGSKELWKETTEGGVRFLQKAK